MKVKILILGLVVEISEKEISKDTNIRSALEPKTEPEDSKPLSQTAKEQKTKPAVKEVFIVNIKSEQPAAGARSRASKQSNSAESLDSKPDKPGASQVLKQNYQIKVTSNKPRNQDTRSKAGGKKNDTVEGVTQEAKDSSTPDNRSVKVSRNQRKQPEDLIKKKLVDSEKKNVGKICGSCVKCKLPECGACVFCQNKNAAGGGKGSLIKVCVKKVCRNRNRS
jgi:hypothetical protein